MLNAIEKIAEDKIRHAIESGEFEKLSGQGKPLKTKKYVHVPGDKRIAHDILRNNGFTLDWIDEGQQIDAAIDTLKKKIISIKSQNKSAQHGFFNCQLTEEINSLNRKIFDYNLKIPDSFFSKNVIDLKNLIKELENNK